MEAPPIPSLATPRPQTPHHGFTRPTSHPSGKAPLLGAPRFLHFPPSLCHPNHEAVGKGLSPAGLLESHSRPPDLERELGRGGLEDTRAGQGRLAAHLGPRPQREGAVGVVSTGVLGLWVSSAAP